MSKKGDGVMGLMNWNGDQYRAVNSDLVPFRSQMHVWTELLITFSRTAGPTQESTHLYISSRGLHF